MNESLLRGLLTTPGVSGREERIRKYVIDQLSSLVDEVSVDAMGNVIGVKHGEEPSVMLSAHMDTIGFLVSHIDDDGFIRFVPVGGFDPRTLVMQRVIVHGKDDYVGLISPSSKPIHLSRPEDRDKAVKIEELFIDLMMPPDQVKANVQVGDPISLCREVVVNEWSFASAYLDDRIGVYIMLEALKRASPKVKVYAVASVQEEVGLRGARTSAYGINPSIGVAIDVTIAGDIPGMDKTQQVTSLGKGAAISIMDADSISDPRLVSQFRSVAEKYNIPYQMEILPRGGTDAGAIQQARAGVPVITLSIPVRYIHTVNESARISDLEATIDLLSKFMEHAHEVNLSW